MATSLKPPMNFDREVPSNDPSHGTFVWKPSFEGKEDGATGPPTDSL